MKIVDDLNHFPAIHHPIVLTIGNFDGVHRGHQIVLDRLTQVSGTQHTEKIVVTFKNHPSQILRPESPVRLICTLQHRLELLRQQHIDYLLLLEFTKTFSQQTAEEFLRKVKKAIPFSHLVLGHDATLGHDRQGDPRMIAKLSKELNFTVEYIEEWLADGANVSSSIIRKHIQEGNFEKTKELLGRSYSIMGEITHGEKQGKRLGYPTANLDVSNLCLPPFGVYAVRLKHGEKVHEGVANLGIAPTMRDNQKPILEVHLFSPVTNLYGEQVEVFFHGFIRPEKKFESPDVLRNQISQDISLAHQLLSKP